jgi:hypothetical protein
MPGAVKKLGPSDKVGYPSGSKGPKRGDAKHSAEGTGAGLLSVLRGPRRASWHFSVLKSGIIWQHYAIDVHCWHAGDTDDDDDVRANIDLIGIEHEGLAGQPLTAEQTAATIEITKFCADYFNRNVAYARFPVQPSDGWTLVEHNEVSNTYTACPSDRIPWDDVLEGLEDDMDPRLDELVKTYGGKPKVFDILTGDGHGGVTWRQDTLTRLKYGDYNALGWLKPEHEHEVTGTAK